MQTRNGDFKTTRSIYFIKFWRAYTNPVNLQEKLLQDLNNMLDQKVFLEDKIKGLSKIIPSLKVIKHEAQDLVNTVNDISESSEKISSKIRSLDIARVSVNY